MRSISWFHSIDRALLKITGNALKFKFMVQICFDLQICELLCLRTFTSMILPMT